MCVSWEVIISVCWPHSCVCIKFRFPTWGNSLGWHWASGLERTLWERQKKGKLKVFLYLWQINSYEWLQGHTGQRQKERSSCGHMAKAIPGMWGPRYSIHKCQRNVHMICVIPKLSIFHISSMTYLHTYCNDRILEWRRNLLLRPWSWNRNLMKLTMQEQGQNAAAGEEREREGKKQEVSSLKIWPRQCRPSWGICTQCVYPWGLIGRTLGMAPIAILSLRLARLGAVES